MIRKRPRGLAQIEQLLFVTLAPTANKEVDVLLDSHPQRHGLVHRLRKNAHHLIAFGRVSSDKNHELRLKPVTAREHGWIPYRTWIVRFARHVFSFVAVCRTSSFPHVRERHLCPSQLEPATPLRNIG